MREKQPFLIDATKIETTNVNISTENRGRGDTAKKVLLLSANVEANVDASVLDQLATGDDHLDYQQSLFRDDGNPKDLGNSNIPYGSEYNDQKIVISGDVDQKIQKMEFITKKIQRFSASLSENRMVKLKFQMQIYPETAKQAWQIMQMLLAPYYVEINEPFQADIECEAA